MKRKEERCIFKDNIYKDDLLRILSANTNKSRLS